MATSVKAELNVVVTGFSPWGSYAPLPNLPINTSWQIAKSLPRVIFRANKPNIRILTYPTPIKTSWGSVRKTVPTLWEGRKEDYAIYIAPSTPETFKIDAMVHLGMDDGVDAPFSFEKQGHKTGFEGSDVDNKVPSENDLNGGAGLWDQCSEILKSDFDVDLICKQVASQIKDLNICTSTNPGRYLCAYLYYTTLAALELSAEPKRVIFVHVPPKHENEDIEAGVAVISKLIEAVADQLPLRQDSEAGKI